MTHIIHVLDMMGRSFLSEGGDEYRVWGCRYIIGHTWRGWLHTSEGFYAITMLVKPFDGLKHKWVLNHHRIVAKIRLLVSQDLFVGV